MSTNPMVAHPIQSTVSEQSDSMQSICPEQIDWSRFICSKRFTVPINLSTDELIEWYVSASPQNIRLVPRHLLTERLVEIAVTKEGGIIRLIPLELRTYNMWLKAISNDVAQFRAMPRHMITKEICDIVSGKTKGHELAYIPDHFMEMQYVKTVISRRVQNFIHLPDHLKTKYKSCYKFAFAHDSNLVTCIPEQYMTPAVCLAVLDTKKPKSGLLRHIPWNRRTRELCAFAVARGLDALQHVPVEYIYDMPEIALISVMKNGVELKDVPVELIDYELASEALNSSFLAYDHIPEALHTLHDDCTDHNHPNFNEMMKRYEGRQNKWRQNGKKNSGNRSSGTFLSKKKIRKLARKLNASANSTTSENLSNVDDSLLFFVDKTSGEIVSVDENKSKKLKYTIE
jgi:hypothetical protein